MTLAGLDVSTPSGSAYLGDLAWALDFARANRRSIEARALEVLAEILQVPLAPDDGIDILLRHLVEEAPAAYRDIGEVLEDQEDLVRRRIRLEPIAVLKG